jgi:hypothetical protein
VHGLDGGFDISERRQHDGRRHIAGILQAAQQAESVQARHVQVREDYVCGKIGQFEKRFVAVAGGFRQHAPGGYQGRQTAALAGFIVHDEYFVGWRNGLALAGSSRYSQARFGTPRSRSFTRS